MNEKGIGANIGGLMQISSTVEVAESLRPAIKDFFDNCKTICTYCEKEHKAGEHMMDDWIEEYKKDLTERMSDEERYNECVRLNKLLDLYTEVDPLSFDSTINMLFNYGKVIPKLKSNNNEEGIKAEILLEYIDKLHNKNL